MGLHDVRKLTGADLAINGYFVSSCGKVLYFKYKNARILKPSVNSDGYEVVNLRLYNQSQLHLVHRLVAVTHLNHDSKRKFVNHLDNNKRNNTVGNLEWCTHKENMQHAIKTGTFMK